MKIQIAVAAATLTAKDVKAQEAIVSQLESDLASAKAKLNRMVKKLASQKASTSVKKVTEVKTTSVKSTKPSTINLKDHPKFDPKLMTGSVWFEAINGTSKRRATVEGYWRTKFNSSLSGLPFPVPMKVKGYDKAKFLAALAKAQGQAKAVTYKGMSANRWTGGSNGAKEYKLGKWSWPAGLTYYISRDVPPSRAFYNFIMGKDLVGLPTYGKD